MDFQKEEIKYQEGFNFEEAIDPLGDGISSVALVRVSGSDLDRVYHWVMKNIECSVRKAS